MRSILFVLPILILCVFIFSSCSDKYPKTANHKQEIIDTDRAMSLLAEKEGFIKAISFYADVDMVKLNDGQFPIIGKKAFDENYGDNAGPKTLTWEPINAEAAISGELGYSWGNWKFVTADTTYYGNYFTVWKKQIDGNWKVALDGGNSTPPPEK